VRLGFWFDGATRIRPFAVLFLLAPQPLPSFANNINFTVSGDLFPYGSRPLCIPMVDNSPALWFNTNSYLYK
jgi:hypothetical protein